jgi:hypothetical protein
VTGELPTVQGVILAHCQVAALCLECGHIEDLDLPALAVSHANMPLIRLPLRCRCGSRRVRIIVSGRHASEDRAGQPRRGQ